MPIIHPTPIIRMESASPIRNSMATAMKPQLAAEKPAAEAMVCSRFCRSRLQYFRQALIGIRATSMATMAPSREVLGVVPILPMMFMHTAPTRKAIRIPGISVHGSKAEIKVCFLYFCFSSSRVCIDIPPRIWVLIYFHFSPQREKKSDYRKYFSILGNTERKNKTRLPHALHWSSNSDGQNTDRSSPIISIIRILFLFKKK